jgi:hypothetical protein
MGWIAKAGRFCEGLVASLALVPSVFAIAVVAVAVIRALG